MLTKGLYGSTLVPLSLGYPLREGTPIYDSCYNHMTDILNGIADITGMPLKETSYIREDEPQHYGFAIDASVSDSIRSQHFLANDLISPQYYLQPLMLHLLLRLTGCCVDLGFFEQLTNSYKQLALIVAIEHNHFHIAIVKVSSPKLANTIFIHPWLLSAPSVVKEETARLVDKLNEGGFVKLIS